MKKTVLNLRFYYDTEYGAPCLDEIWRENFIKQFSSLQMGALAYQIAKDKSLPITHKRFLETFCKRFIENMKELDKSKVTEG